MMEKNTKVRLLTISVVIFGMLISGVGSATAQQVQENSVETQQSVTTQANTFEPNIESPEAETADIEVTVIDSNGNPIEGAAVELEDRGGSPDDRLATTGSDGRARFIESLGPPPENCQTVKLRLSNGRSRSADLGCRNGGNGVTVTHTFQVDESIVQKRSTNTFEPNIESPEAETADIEVTVIDSNGNPIEGAAVELEDRGGSPDDRLATTGSDGRARFIESLGPPPENCQTVKLRLSNGRSRSADLGCRNGGNGVTVTHTFQISNTLSQNNPFGDSNGNPVSRSIVINRVVQWNLNGEINGTSYTRQEIIDFVVQWNLAS